MLFGGRTIMSGSSFQTPERPKGSGHGHARPRYLPNLLWQLDALLAAPSSGSQDSINSGVQTSGHSKGVNRFFYKTLGPELGQTTLRDTQQGALR